MRIKRTKGKITITMSPYALRQLENRLYYFTAPSLQIAAILDFAYALKWRPRPAATIGPLTVEVYTHKGGPFRWSDRKLRVKVIRG
jgi:hypothetical protein